MMAETNWWEPNANHLNILRQGITVWNEWRENNPEIIPIFRNADLSKADLQFANLSNVQFHKANLSYANLKNAILYQAECFGADLREANLSATDMRGAKFHIADLRGANLQKSDLFRVDFISTKLESAKLNFARCMTTAFTDVNLSDIIGLEDVIHTGPSNIDTSTLFKLRSPIPKSFLIGVGVPDKLISQIPSLISSDEGEKFYSCFISYSTKDENFAKKLYSKMQEAHLRVWFAPENIKGGEKIFEQIDRAIKTYDKLLIVLSENSLSSKWVETELRKARKAELKDGKRKLFPIRLVDYERIKQWECFDGDAGVDLAEEVREYYIPDFSNWHKEVDFDGAFKKLIKDLEAS